MKLKTRKEAAAMLGITPSTLDVWRKDPDMNFPPIREMSPKVKGWLPADINDWQAARLGILNSALK